MKCSYLFWNVLAACSAGRALGTNEAPAAQWMSGKMGVGFRIDADRKTNIANYNVETLVNQIKSIGGVNHIIVNLSDAAHGDAYLAPHSVLTRINPLSTPPDDRDLFMEIATAFQEINIKVIAYMATQGPAMLKHPTKAFDYEIVNGTGFSQGMENWRQYVAGRYGSASDDNYKQAYAEVIVDEYAERYGKLIDGYWFDHAKFGNIPLLYNVTKKHNPNTVLAFNDGQKVPLTNNAPGYEDYTAGHPNPVKHTVPSSPDNLPQVESIENTPAGYFVSNTSSSLGHAFTPLQTVWNSGPIVWSLEAAVAWTNRALSAGGAVTWNVETSDSTSELAAASAAFLKNITDETIFSPVPEQKYYIDAAASDFRLASNGRGRSPFTVSQNTTGANVEWEFISSGKGSWSIQRAAGGRFPLLRANNSGGAIMNEVTKTHGSKDALMFFDVTPGKEDDSEYLKLPDAPFNTNRIQLRETGDVSFAFGSADDSLASFYLIPVTE